MYTLLGIRKQEAAAQLIGARWHELKKQLNFNLMTVLKYYHKANRYLANDNIINKLLIANPVDVSLDLKTFTNAAEASTLKLARLVGMHTHQQMGYMHYGQFYSKDITELIFGYSDVVDPFELDKQWMDLAPIQVLYHPRTDLSLYPLDGSRVSAEDGYAVIAINIPMLLIQWRAYVAHCKKYRTEPLISRTEFIVRYPITNMLKSHFDLTILNRMYHRLHKIVTSESSKKHPFPITDWSTRLNNFQDEHIRLIQERSYSFNSVMSNIPLISFADMQECMKLPFIVPSRQILWLLVLSRVKYLRLVLELSSNRSLERDTLELAVIKRKITQYRNDNTMLAQLPAYIRQNVNMDFDKILSYT